MNRRRRGLCALLLILWCVLTRSHGAGEPLLVIYPEAPTPYREAFEQLMTGIAHATGQPLHRKRMTTTTSPAELHRWLEQEGRTPPVVLLGQPALHLYERLPPSLRRVFVGGVNALPGQTPWPGVSLTIDPALYLQTLHDLLPDIRRVVVFYDPQEQSWIARVRTAAATAGLQVDAVAIRDAIEAIRQLGARLPTLNAQTTALWFGRNTITLDTELIYPYVLEQAWDHHIAVFSDTLAHVRRGFLFTLYPDYSAVGIEIGRQIRQDVATDPTGLQFTRAVELALNVRTARHLRIPLGDPLMRRVKTRFPEP
jgi:putative ABC transport system substrate-binding protein